MRWIYGFSWIGKMLCIAAVTSLICIGCGMLVCKGKGCSMRPRWIALIAAVNFLVVAVVCILLARTPMLIDMA